MHFFPLSNRSNRPIPFVNVHRVLSRHVFLNHMATMPVPVPETRQWEANPWEPLPKPNTPQPLAATGGVKGSGSCHRDRCNARVKERHNVHNQIRDHVPDRTRVTPSLHASNWKRRCEKRRPQHEARGGAWIEANHEATTLDRG